MRWTAVIVSVVLLLAGVSYTLAQMEPAPEETKMAGATQQKKSGGDKSKAPAQKPQTPQQQQLAMPSAETIVLLLRNTLITLNDALQTGNYTVLRDRGAPGFSNANSAGKLSQIFANLASRGLDLSVVSVLTPQLTEAPTLDQKAGMLRLKGYFPSQPVQINFEILYQVVGGRWRLFGIAVTPSQAAPPSDSAPG